MRLAEIFQTELDDAAEQSPALAAETRKVVILGVAEKRIALLVDHLLGQEATVVKPLGNYLHRCSGLAGATISGDGRVRLVLDPSGLLSTSQSAQLNRKASA
jgi:two-component system chemotaxis sensor kinase CheA